MGFKYEHRSIDEIVSTAEQLKSCADSLLAVAADMQKNGMQQGIFPWVSATWKSIGSVVELCGMSEAMLPEQILAKKQGRKSKYELAMEKSVIDVAKRRERQTETSPPKKPRGRPRKGTAT